MTANDDKYVGLALRPARNFKVLANLAYSVLLLSTMASCIIPAPLKLEGADAELNSWPVIVGVNNPDFSFRSPFQLSVNDDRRMPLEVFDVDIQDTLFVAIYLDYYLVPSPPRVTCSAAAGQASRIADCSTALICPPGGDGIHKLEVMVSDAARLGEGEPAFQALPPGAGFSIRTMDITCTQ